MNKKIYITGCAKSGTTLVRRLFNAFEGLNVYNYGEITPKDFYTSEYDVGKRFQSLFSGELPNPLITQQLEMFQEIIIIDVLRNKEDVLKSDNGYVSENRYNTCLKQREQYGYLIDYTIIYENLLSDPDQIQKEISELLGLKTEHKWSDYPKFIDITQENQITHKGIYKLRSIGAPKN
jgi:hypothetical protein